MPEPHNNHQGESEIPAATEQDDIELTERQLKKVIGGGRRSTPYYKSNDSEAMIDPELIEGWLYRNFRNI